MQAVTFLGNWPIVNHVVALEILTWESMPMMISKLTKRVIQCRNRCKLPYESKLCNIFGTRGSMKSIYRVQFHAWIQFGVTRFTLQISNVFKRLLLPQFSSNLLSSYGTYANQGRGGGGHTGYYFLGHGASYIFHPMSIKLHQDICYHGGNRGCCCSW